VSSLRLWLVNRLYEWYLRLLPRGPEIAGYTRGERSYATVGINEPEPLRHRDQVRLDRPIVVLTIDSLEVGRPIRMVMSPAQATALFRVGLDFVERQCELFGDVDPRDYDVRQIRVD